MPLLLAALLVLTLVSAADARVSWRWPVPGRNVLRGFVVGPDRYAPGQHRGVTLAAPPGETVVAACAGRVKFAGRVGTSGATVSVACGALNATLTHLGAVVARRGAFVVPGERVGVAGPSGRVQLGARIRARRDGYVDPLRLLGAPPAAPVGPAPPGLRLRRLPPPPRAEPGRAPASAASPLWPAALGLGLLGAAGVFGAARRVRRPAALRSGGVGRRGRVRGL